MRAVHIARLYLATTFGRRSMLVPALVMPLLFTWILGLGIGRREGPLPPVAIRVASADAGNLDELLIERLRRRPALDVGEAASWDEARRAVEARQAVGALRIPRELSERLLRRDEARVELVTRTDDLRQVQVVEQSILTAANELTGLLAAARVSVRSAGELGLFDHPTAALSASEYFASSLALAALSLDDAPHARVDVRAVGRAGGSGSVAAGFEQSSPGMLVMFAMFYLFGGASMLVTERERGTLRRLAVLPLRPATVLGGHLLGLLVAGLAQMSLLILAGELLFGVDWGRSPLGLALIVASFALAVASAGLLLATLVRTQAQASAVRNLAVLVMAALGGAWWPLEIVPSWMRTLGHALPSAWAMDAFHDVVLRGLGVAAALPECGVLAGFAAVFLALAARRFRGA